MVNKKVTKEDNDNFWAAFDMRHPDISKDLVNREFIGDIIGFLVRQPKTMSNDKFKVYIRYLNRWLSDKGFIEPERDFVVVALVNGVRLVYTDAIIKIDRDGNGFCRVTFKEDGTDNILALLVNEDLEDLKANVYIF